MPHFNFNIWKVSQNLFHIKFCTKLCDYNYIIILYFVTILSIILISNILLKFQKTVTMRVTYSNRDILNLGANLREPSWHRWDPRKPQYDSVDNIPITCNSVFYRLDGRNNCREDFPVVSSANNFKKLFPKTITYTWEENFKD